VIQPHLPVRLPCYDFALLAERTLSTLASIFRYPRLSWRDGRCVQGPRTYSPRRC